MNKKYFTRHLPVEGEVQDGDWFFFEGRNLPLRKDSKLEAECPLSTDDNPKIKVKLFLCSRDIQVGDKGYNPNPYRNYELEEIIICETPEGYKLGFLTANYPDGHNKVPFYVPQPFKIIGEISPEAMWVKEGDEFDEDEVKQIWWHPIGDCETIPPRDENYTKKLKRFMILGPCKHFH